MFMLCLNTCLHNDWKDSYTLFETCLHITWRHINTKFKSMLSQFLKTWLYNLETYLCHVLHKTEHWVIVIGSIFDTHVNRRYSDDNTQHRKNRKYRLQRRTGCKIQNGRQGAPKWPTGAGKVSTYEFLGVQSNFH